MSPCKANFKAHISLCLNLSWFPSVSVSRRHGLAVSCSLVSAVCRAAHPAPNCSCVQCCRGGGCSKGGGAASIQQPSQSSVSQSSTDKNVPFYHHHRVAAVHRWAPLVLAPPAPVHLSSGVQGLDSQKSSPAPAASPASTTSAQPMICIHPKIISG